MPATIPKAKKKTVPPATNDCDVFELAKEAYRVADLWQDFDLPGAPATSCRSPFREDNHPSFSVYDDGRKWKDHATDEGGDVIEFIRYAIDGDHSDVRDWLLERMGINKLGGRPTPKAAPLKPQAQSPKKSIEFPSKLIRGTEETWTAFANMRSYSHPGVELMIENGILRFMKIEGTKCFVILDEELRAAEIRRIDGKRFFKDTKAYPLKGVDKSWLPGSSLLRSAPDNGCVLVCEGATDLLTAFDLYSMFCSCKFGNKHWTPIAVLGAGCKALSPECAELIRGRHVRLAADADEAGSAMTEHWGNKFCDMGCLVDMVEIGPFTPPSPLDDRPQPNDLSDVADRMIKMDLAKAIFS